MAAREADSCVLIEVEDTGPGIPHRIRDRLFQPFVTAGKRDGLGLGLALSRQPILNHGGDIWTEPSAGAPFVIRFPLNRARPDRLFDRAELVLGTGKKAQKVQIERERKS